MRTMMKYACFYAGFFFLAFSLSGCGSYNDRLYREGMAKYYQSINGDGPLAPAQTVTGQKPYQNPTPTTYAIHDRYGNFQGTVKARGY